MEVILAKSAGFCFGVQRAVDVVNKQIEEGVSPLYTYGPIIHNEEVVKDFESHGVQVMDEDSNKNYEPGTVIIRSHGVTKAVEEGLKAAGHNVIDATCPFVKKIHRAVDEHSKNGEYIVIIGNPDHPEVRGIVGWINGDKYTVISGEQSAKDFSVNSHDTICIVSQTTFNHNKFQELVEIIKQKGYHIIVLNTICDATNKRQVEAFDIASQVDAMLVIGSKNSSNTQKLYEICKTRCNNTYYIQTADDFQPSDLSSIESVGITAGASTPNNIIEEVQKKCQK
ncbi:MULTISPECIES: 4-hydroxy-3-methylbut-2-enyl diphosphate reductase [Pseudobutyrivibrio]|uniref:4-hydroxy-3-methylbut-2-enyl diphosphate reductase n=2 Tax=Pseudobutyrivibrio ruminis TaxID=46206 RepID=A0A1H7FTI1_9FIRM|nr:MULTISPECIES: 4-hydroxy-3-methylbut-2-enyl diphosphate reductase [Pseudobutyrivibrio]SEK29393.1 4-hydroxy-3-methylbut-2-enyl diphosphate reductase [Pseudobutyrivibrio ruminis]SES69036.1 4-hydroxy-3-methylbut-2-enyl diphosphate reductase [Pseudobutyrivibrio sp. C4]SFN98479.1 4-hydroxy-3-methylbut-2-enyl diphosphate reductase [Pseudobutyrivibrio sp. JW11]SOB91476.1 4-hydroxy-3-methylbut-2-enyl diphosphate reductase [Pseudobutyrivibrio ruminis DSM 9787]